MRRTYAHQVIAVSVSLLLIAISPSATAQEELDDLLPSAACFVRAGSNGKAISVIVPRQSAAAMRAKEFTREPCRTSFATLAQRETYRDSVCHFASTYRPEQIAVFEELYGERPGVLCGLAQAAISQWKFRERGQAN